MSKFPSVLSPAASRLNSAGAPDYLSAVIRLAVPTRQRLQPFPPATKAGLRKGFFLLYPTGPSLHLEFTLKIWP